MTWFEPGIVREIKLKSDAENQVSSAVRVTGQCNSAHMREPGPLEWKPTKQNSRTTAIASLNFINIFNPALAEKDAGCFVEEG
jgi:hypothetical protein